MAKKYIVLILIIIIYIIVFTVLSIFTEGNKRYLIFFDGKNLKYDKKWSVINDKIPDENYNIVKDGVVISNEKINMYSELANEAVINKNIFAYRGNITIKPYKKVEINDYSFVEKILSDNHIDVNIDDVSTKDLYNIDIDGDNENEKIYAISNSDIETGDLFSIIIAQNKENYVIIDIKKFKSEFGSYFPCLYFVDVDNDGILELILKKVYASNEGQKISILKINQDFKNYDVIFRED